MSKIKQPQFDSFHNISHASGDLVQENIDYNYVNKKRTEAEKMRGKKNRYQTILVKKH